MNFYKKLGFTLLTLEIVLLFFYIINIFPTFALLLLSSFLLSIFFSAFNFAFIANAEKTKLVCIDLFNDYSFISKKLYFFKPENDFFTTTKELICCYIGGITIATTIKTSLTTYLNLAHKYAVTLATKVLKKAHPTAYKIAFVYCPTRFTYKNPWSASFTFTIIDVNAVT